MPIKLASNLKWLDKKTRPAWKYSPVTVVNPATDLEKAAMAAVVEERVKACQELALIRKPGLEHCSWFGFLHDQMRERNLRPHNVPIFVLSGGNAKRIKKEFDDAKGYTLAWHPATARNEPVYLFVHKSDYRTYQKTLETEFATYRNFFLVGWDGGELTGFGVARAAVLAYADNLPYAPQRLLMMDQDVVAVESTRHTEPGVAKSILDMHDTTGKPVIGYGVGYAERSASILSTAEQLKDDKAYKDAVKQKKPSPMTPTQQYVSIKAPFRKRDDGVYPAFMVAGGEDMLMTQRTESYAKDAKQRVIGNATIRQEKIFKKQLTGEGDTPNTYWTRDRIITLDKLFEFEKNAEVSYDGRSTTLGELCESFVIADHIDKGEKAGTCALIIERIILKANQTVGAWPKQYEGAVLNRHD